MMKNSLSFVLRGCLLISVSLALSAHATQIVQPVKDVGGTAFGVGANGTSWTTSAGVGTVVTVIGRYTTDTSGGGESGLGLKVKYDETKFTAGSVSVTALSTKCMIAPPQVQSAGAASQAVLGWIDTAIRTPAGAVAWPYAADPASPNGCLNPNTPANDVSATAAGAVNLFQFQGTLAPGVTVGSTTDIIVTAENNFSYAGATPGMLDQKVTVTAAAPPACSLDVDGVGGVVAFRDGLLILRHLLTFSGTALTAGMTGPVPDATLVANNINGMIGQLDINGNIPAAAPTPFQDGLLLLRMMLGFNGPSLTAGMTFNATNSQRFTSPDLINYVNATCGTSYPPGL
jgi:hypothetical protein